MTTDDDQLLAAIGRRNWLILTALVLVSLSWRSWSVTLGVLAGGILVIINYRWLGRSLVKLLSDPGRPAQQGFKRSYLFRLAFVAAAIYLLLVRGGVHPVALAVGLSVVVINLLLTTVKRIY